MTARNAKNPIAIIAFPDFVRLVIAFFGPIVAPFIILYLVFAYFCFKEKKWSYTGSLILSIIAIVLFFIISFPGLMMPEEDQGPPAVFIALLMILPVLLAVKSYEALDSITK